MKFQKEFDCSVDFFGLLSRQTCSEIAIELIKYVLVQREQVPGPFNSLQLLARKSQPRPEPQLEAQQYEANIESSSDDHLRSKGPSRSSSSVHEQHHQGHDGDHHHRHHHVSSLQLHNNILNRNKLTAIPSGERNTEARTDDDHDVVNNTTRNSLVVNTLHRHTHQPHQQQSSCPQTAAQGQFGSGRLREDPDYCLQPLTTCRSIKTNYSHSVSKDTKTKSKTITITKT